MTGPGPVFRVATAMDGDAARVQVYGELDIATGPELVANVTQLLGDPGKRIVMDLLAATFVDSSGLRALLDCRRLARERGVEYRLAVGTDTPAAKLLDVAGVTAYFDYEVSENV